jgi:5-methylcytosine-specific restriction endonuclease McrA
MAGPRSPKRKRPTAELAELKEAVRCRDRYRCVECGMTAAEHIVLTGRTLEVHRLAPGEPYTLERSVTLCRGCHGPKPRSPHGSAPLATVHLPRSLWIKVGLIAATQGLRPVAWLESVLRPLVEADAERLPRPPG